MIEQRTVNAGKCDGCGRVRLAANDSEPIVGFVGTITEHTGVGGRSAKWYACGKRCIGKAAYTAVSREDDDQAQQGVLAL